MNKLLLTFFFFSLIHLLSAQNVLISEIADPDDNAGCRFIEIHCEGPMPCDLDGYELRRWTNGNASTTGVEDLTPIGILAVSDNAVIAANATSFMTCYGFTPDINAGTGGPADSNGDDQIGIFDDSGTLVDIFGVPGEDGTNTCHEFEDGRALRNTTVENPSATWVESQWTVWSDASSASGCTAHMSGDPQDAVDMDPGQSALPVELVSFRATKFNSENVISWATATELNNEMFLVERSNDGHRFYDLGSVKGQGTSTAFSEYNFTDYSPITGLNYYRLKQLDYDGAIEYSSIITVDNREDATIKVYPTNFSDVLTIEADDKAELKIFSITGKLIMNQTLDNTKTVVDLTGIAAGSYFVAVTTGTNTITKQVIKQ